MFKEKNIIISRYSSLNARNNMQVTLNEELFAIRDGLVGSEIKECRLLLEKGLTNEYKIAKAKLPAVTFSGTFNLSHKADNLLYYSNLMVVDFDGLNGDSLNKIKSEIFSESFVVSTWISPSNRGIKVLIKTNATIENHKLYFSEISKYFNLKFNIFSDKSGSDICRLCFTSHDPDILIKDNAIPFSIDFEKLSLDQSQKKSTPTDNPLKEKKSVISEIDKSLYLATEGRNSKKDRNTIDKIIRFLRTRKLSITSNYEDWYRVGLAIANTFTYDLGKKYYLYLCELDGNHHDAYKSSWMLDYCYQHRKINEINFATIIYLAEQKGFVVNMKQNDKLVETLEQ